MAADGSITFSTELDNDQLEKDLKKAESEVEGLKRKIEKASREKSAIEQELEGAKRAAAEAREEVDSLRASMGVSPDMDLDGEFKRASQEAASLERKLAGIEEKKAVAGSKWDEEAKKIQEAEAWVEHLKARLVELRATDPMDEEAWHAAQRYIPKVEAEIKSSEAALVKQYQTSHKLYEKYADLTKQADAVRDRLSEVAATRDDLGAKKAPIDEANERLREQERELAGIEKRWETASRKAEAYNRDLEAASGRASDLGEAYGEAMAKSNSATTRATEAMRGAFDQMGKRINTMIKRVFVLQVALSALRGLRSMLSEALMENDRFSASVAALKASFQGVVNYVASAVAPAITAMVNVAASAIINLARLIDSLFGTSIMKSIAKAREAAQAAWRQTDASKAAAKAAEKQAKAAKKLAKATDKATKSVMGFDEINALSADDASDAADALGDEADGIAGDGLKPDWDALDVGKIDAKLSEIMLILGAALLAVGAILAFSGINIPLGITLMAIGALMIYAAYKENWDKLPQDVRNAITGMLVITGIVLLAIGAVLALSGANVPLGVGMMAAGALMIWTAVGLNWNSMPAQMQAVVSGLMLLLGLALLAVGAILAFSGGNVPLGVALMAVGAASLAAVVVLNWQELSGSLAEAVSTVMGVLGAAALVIGAVLAFSGGNVPLGVALMAVGALAMAGAVALRWNKLPGEIKKVVSTITGIVSVALLVLGAVLTFSMANPTLGLGLLMLGAASLASIAALNWNSLPTAVRVVVSTIMGIVGVALLVLGAVIAFSGAYLPLGIALLAAGAAALAGAMALNWNTIPENVRSVVSVVLAIMGGALLVLGTVLLFTGAGIPIGLGCIVAGAASLAAAITPNWNYLKDKVKEVWAGIVRWWNSNVKKIFTWNWWAEVFKSVVNGLIWCVNKGLGVFGDFCNGIGSAISSTLEAFGVTGYSFTVTMGQIPYLAQGAVIPPNREFMAVLGDQRSGNNIETPEALMRQVVREEAGAMMAELVRQLATMGPASAQPARSQGDLVLVVDGRELGRASMRGIRDLDATGELGSGLSLLYS